MYAEFLHARKESRAIDAQTCSRPIVTANTAVTLCKCADNCLALIFGLLVINTFLVIERVKSFFHYSRNVVTVLSGRRLRRLVRASSAQFRERCFPCTAAREDHGALDEVCQFSDVPRPVPFGQYRHRGCRYRFDLLLHLLGELLGKVASQHWNIFTTLA